MIYIVSIQLLLFSATYCCAQEIDSIQNEINVLEKKKDSLVNVIDYVNSELFNLQQKKLKQIHSDGLNKGLMISTTRETFLYQDRATYSKILDTISKGYSFISYNYQNNYYLVEYDTLTGYLFSIDVETTNQKNERIKKENEERKLEAEELERISTIERNKRLKIEAANIKKDKDRLSQLVLKYGETIGNKLHQKKIWLGMSKDMVLDSWGTPNDVNTTVGSWGVHEQLVYPGGTYLYVKNGKLTSWQY